jgi:hypothetical protein
MIDIVILSSCFGGSPRTIAALSPFAQYIVASPDNLHLSYFDLHSLEGLDRQPFSSDPGALAVDFAQNAFTRLERGILTAVTVAVYDVSRIRPYLNSVIKVYDDRLDLLEEKNPALIEHCDCVESIDYVFSGMSTGVQVFYRPPASEDNKTN